MQAICTQYEGHTYILGTLLYKMVDICSSSLKLVHKDLKTTQHSTGIKMAQATAGALWLGV